MQLNREHSTYGLPTRLLHGGLAITIVVQLVSSLTMDAEGGGNSVFKVHQVSGTIAFGLVLLFWLLGLIRRRGTPIARLVPWFSARLRAELWQDLGAHVRALLRLRLPEPQGGGADEPLASAVHGLGLFLMTAMGGSGFLYLLVNTGDPRAGGLVGLAMTVHTTLANLAWAYLIGHAGTAMLQTLAGRSMRRMWSLAARD